MHMQNIELNFLMLVFQKEAGNFEIKGHLILNDDEEEQILNILKEYSTAPTDETKFYFDVHYLNGEKSEQFIVKIYDILKIVPNSHFFWKYQAEDLGGQELGLDLIEELDIPFEMVEVKSSG